MFKPDMFEIPIYVKVSKREFQDIVDRNCVYNTISDEIYIIFISKFKELTLKHYINQPRSMLCRMLEENILKKTIFCMKMKCLIINFSRFILDI